MPRRTWDTIPSSRRIASRIIRLLWRDQRYREIGAEVNNLSKARVGQWVDRLRSKYGERAVRPKKRRWTKREVARELGVDSDLLTLACEDLGLSPRFNGRAYSFIKGEIDQLRSHLKSIRSKECEICHKEFMARDIRRTICYEDKCCTERGRKRRQSQLGPESLTGWRKEVWMCLQECSISEHDDWILQSQAAELAGITLMQLQWLAMHQVLTIRYGDKIHHLSHKPVRLFSANEMRLVREIYAAYMGQSNSRKAG